MSHPRVMALAIFWIMAVVLLSPAMASSGELRNGLPPTSMDSFVFEAKDQAELIYGDESFSGPPPYELFDKTHRINTGILDTRDAGLTTGHGSYLPDASGRDEFLGAELSMSGPQGVSASSGFYAGLPYMTPSAVAANPQQFPGGFNTLNTVGGQVNESAWTTAEPTAWNQNGGTWQADGSNKWINQAGDTITSSGVITSPGTKDVYYPDGSILYNGDPNYPNGTIIAPDGRIIYPSGTNPNKEKNDGNNPDAGAWF